MIPKVRFVLGATAFAGALFACTFSLRAQQAPQKETTAPAAILSYDVSREAVVQGTVVSFTAASTVAPIGPHATIQTSSGMVDVHLGSAVLMKQSDIFLAPGDAVKIVGQSQTFGTTPVFIARILQKGSQTVVLRNLKGIPIVAKPAANAKQRSILAGAR